ncbi:MULTISPECIES: MgtC/SapB family protein [Bacillus]|uniref:MgtC/SapB family protein n=1 Tax=Bacillus TaxID=1386 RepID=UPI002E1BF71D|nr:MgtC/SapB family protein [Bacillus smithii]MED1421443.1 MgtC/SapB family protein [Bacillus smithii]MED1456108.1 MgtC/SapB family protein [Bacillus smithii]MED1490896.1 MgtC/SapB family protein [Bacillus smithii]
MDFHILVKLVISAVLGLIIGLERELKRKPVGLKTSLVISIVSCLLTIVSSESAYVFPANHDVNITMDPLRLAAQIVSGIGFLGAGVILRRGNDSISGLTTAAIIWGAAGIGIAVGAGFYVEAIAGVVLLIISVEIIPLVFLVIGPKKLREKEVLLKMTIKNKEQIQEVIDIIQKDKITIDNIHIKDLKDGNTHLLELNVSVDFRRRTTQLYYSVSEIPGVENVEIESL